MTKLYSVIDAIFVLRFGNPHERIEGEPAGGARLPGAGEQLQSFAVIVWCIALAQDENEVCPLASHFGCRPATGYAATAL